MSDDCGGAVVVCEAIQTAVVPSVPNLLNLARTAAESKNYQQAYCKYPGFMSTHK
jgi:hypothetical protein